MNTATLNRRRLLKSLGTAGLAAAAPMGRAAGPSVASGAPSEIKPTVVHTRELMAREPEKHLWHLHQTPVSRTNLVQMRGESARHIHPDAAHSLYVISGELKATVGDEEIVLREGDFISIPAGVPHGYAVPGGGTALLVSMDSPPYDPAKTVPAKKDGK